MIIVLRISEPEDFHWPEIPFIKTWEIDNEARISKKAEMKRKFNRSQKRITPWDIQLSSLTSLLYRICRLIGHMFKGVRWCSVNNTNMMSRRNIRNLSLAYLNICVGSWYEAIGKSHIPNSDKYLKGSVLRRNLKAFTL